MPEAKKKEEPPRTWRVLRRKWQQATLPLEGPPELRAPLHQKALLVVRTDPNGNVMDQAEKLKLFSAEFVDFLCRK